MSAARSGRDKAFQSLGRESADIRQEQRQLEAGVDHPDLVPVMAEGQGVLTAFSPLLSAFEAATARLGLERFERGQYKRLTQYIHDVERPARTPDPLDTIIVLTPFVLGEAALVAPTYVASGYADWVTAIGFSLAFSFAVNGAGLIAGFMFLRYAFVRLRSPAPPAPFDWLKRLGAQCGFLTSLAAIGVVAFASLRTQALGPDAANIWDFSELGFWDTFAPPKAIITLLIALIGAILAIYKGFTGFTDPVPNLSEATRYAEHDLAAAVDDLVASFDDEIADLADDFVERAEELLDDIESGVRDFALDASSLLDRPDACNARIDREIASVRDHAAQTARVRARVTGREGGDGVAVDVSALEALRLAPFDPAAFQPDPKTQEQVKELRKIVAEVRAAASDMRVRMRVAEAEFFSASIDLDTTPEVKG